MGKSTIGRDISNAYKTQNFEPQDIQLYKEGGSKSKTKKAMNRLIVAHNNNTRTIAENRNLNMLNSTLGFLLKDTDLAKIRNACNLSAQIATDPVNYIRGKHGHTKVQRAIDLIIVGPVAAIADTIANIVMTILGGGLSLMAAATFASNKLRSKSTVEAKENLFEAMGLFTGGFAKAVHSVMRIFPIAGPFIAYSASILCSVDYADIMRSKKVENLM